MLRRCNRNIVRSKKPTPKNVGRRSLLGKLGVFFLLRTVFRLHLLNLAHTIIVKSRWFHMILFTVSIYCIEIDFAIVPCTLDALHCTTSRLRLLSVLLWSKGFWWRTVFFTLLCQYYIIGRATWMRDIFKIKRLAQTRRQRFPSHKKRWFVFFMIIIMFSARSGGNRDGIGCLRSSPKGVSKARFFAVFGWSQVPKKPTINSTLQHS